MPESVELVLFIIGAYLIGSIPMAYLAVKWYCGEDIRRYGSGQVGASNVFRNFSKPLGIAVGFFDCAKGVLLVWTAGLLGMGIIEQLAIGIAVICGHNWPVFLNFNAGRGLATTVGIALYLLPWGIIPFVFFALFTFVVKGSPLPLLVSMASLPVTSWALQFFGRPQPLSLTLGLAALFFLMVIRRLTAPKTEVSRSVSTRELLINRLLFDRDIRDAKTWVGRKPRAEELSCRSGKSGKG